MEQVSHRPLGEKMIDAKDGWLVEHAVQLCVEIARGGKIVAERLFDRQAGAGHAADRAHALDGHGEKFRRNGEVIQRMLRSAERATQLVQGFGTAQIAVDILQKTTERFECCVVDVDFSCQYAFPHIGHEACGVPSGPPDANDRRGEATLPHQPEQRRVEHFGGEIAAGSEYDQRVRMPRWHREGLVVRSRRCAVARGNLLREPYILSQKFAR